MPKPNQITPVKRMDLGGKRTWGMKVREKIDSSKHINTLEQIADGTLEGTQVQLNAIRMLLDRTVPTIAPVKREEAGGLNAKSITNDKLFAIIEGKASRVEDE